MKTESGGSTAGWGERFRPPHSKRLKLGLGLGVLLVPAIAVWIIVQRDFSRSGKALAVCLAFVGSVGWLYALNGDFRRDLAERAAERAAGKEQVASVDQGSGGKDQDDSPQVTTEQLEVATCGGDVNCAGGRHQMRASRECRRAIEPKARYAFRWTDGLLDSKLPRARWSTRHDIVQRFGPKRIIEYQGNALQLQNGFGAWARVSYECDFDPVTERLIDARLEGAGLY